VRTPIRRATLALLCACMYSACAPPIRPTVAPQAAQQRMEEFWEDIDPSEREDLFHGVGGRRHRPDPEALYEALSKDTTGFSDGYDVVDPSGLEWSVKIGDEAQSEVAASRLVWVMGYRQPPVYYLPEWRVRHEGRVLSEGPARFRPKLPELDNTGTWSWHQNPFVGTQPYRGLLVLMMIINSTDLKADNNALYEHRVNGRRERWYVVKDLGASFGTTGILNPKRNDVDEFEEHGFIEEIHDGRVEFAYRGRHQEILDDITPDDVRWMCERLARLTDRQWRDIFRAAGHTPDVTARYTRKLREKIDEGRALAGGASRAAGAQGPARPARNP